MFSRLIRLAAATLAAVGMPLAAQATLIVYFNQSDFLEAVTGVATDSFQDLPLGPVSDPLIRTVNGFGYTASVLGEPDGFAMVGTPADVWLSTSDPFGPITFSGFTGGVSAIGGFFFNTDSSGVPQSRELAVVVTDSDGTPPETLLFGTTPTTFLGFVSTGSILSLSVNADNSASGSEPGSLEFTWPTVNDLILARRAQTEPPRPTPEPGTLALLGLAAAGLGAVRRWRRQ